jgi:hypothetical protein
MQCHRPPGDGYLDRRHRRADCAICTARQRFSVDALTPTSRETTSTGELSGGSSQATTRSL